MHEITLYCKSLGKICIYIFNTYYSEKFGQLYFLGSFKSLFFATYDTILGIKLPTAKDIIQQNKCQIRKTGKIWLAVCQTMGPSSFLAVYPKAAYILNNDCQLLTTVITATTILKSAAVSNLPIDNCSQCPNSPDT